MIMVTKNHKYEQQDNSLHSFSLSSMRDYYCDVAHARAIIKELKRCPQLEKLT